MIIAIIVTCKYDLKYQIPRELINIDNLYLGEDIKLLQNKFELYYNNSTDMWTAHIDSNKYFNLIIIQTNNLKGGIVKSISLGKRENINPRLIKGDYEEILNFCTDVWGNPIEQKKKKYLDMEIQSTVWKVNDNIYAELLNTPPDIDIEIIESYKVFPIVFTLTIECI